MADFLGIVFLFFFTQHLNLKLGSIKIIYSLFFNKNSAKDFSDKSDQNSIFQIHFDGNLIHQYIKTKMINQNSKIKNHKKEFKAQQEDQSHLFYEQCDIPTREEMSEVLKQLSLSYDQQNLVKMIDCLYHLKEKQKRQLQRKGYIFKQTQKKVVRQIEPPPHNLKTYPKRQYLPMFQTRQQLQKYEHRRICALAFCYNGYGLEGARVQVSQSNLPLQITKDRYKNLSWAFMGTAIKTLMDFVIGNCNIAVEPLSYLQIKSLVIPFLNCRTLFEEDLVMAVMKFVKAAYQLEQVVISENQSLKLLKKAIQILNQNSKSAHSQSQILESINLKQENLQNLTSSQQAPKFLQKGLLFFNKKGQKERIWTKDEEEILVKQYLVDRSYQRVRDSFRKKYGFQTMFQNLKTVRKKFLSIIRQAIQKTTKYHKLHSNELPHLPNLPDIIIKKFITFPSGSQARASLCKVYLLKQYNREVVAQAIEGCLWAVNERRKRDLSFGLIHDEPAHIISL